MEHVENHEDVQHTGRSVIFLTYLHGQRYKSVSIGLISFEVIYLELLCGFQILEISEAYSILVELAYCSVSFTSGLSGARVILNVCLR